MVKSEILSVNEEKKELSIREGEGEEGEGRGEDQIQHLNLLNEDLENNQLNSIKDAEEIITDNKNEFDMQNINSNDKDQNSPCFPNSPDEPQLFLRNVENNILNPDKSYNLSNLENIQDNNKDKLYIIELEQKIKRLNSTNQEFALKTSKLNEDKTGLEVKVMKMKQNIMDVKSKLDVEINKKFERKDIELKDNKYKLATYEKKIEFMNKEILRLKKFEDHYKAIRAKYNQSLVEKMELEEFILQQDEKIHEMTGQISMIEEAFEKKSEELDINEHNCMALMKLIDDQKKTIKQLHFKLKKRDEDEAQRKLIFSEKEQEVHFLKNFINSLKNEMKEQNLSVIRNKLEKANVENKQLNNVIKSVELKKKQTEIKKSNKKLISPIYKKNNPNGVYNNGSYANNSYNNSMNDVDLNDINDDNLKEITILMKKILED